MAKSESNDKQYINYNLSLVNPQDIDVSTPVKVKLLKENASGDVVDTNDFDIVSAELGTNFKLENAVSPEIIPHYKSKIEFDITSTSKDEEKNENVVEVDSEVPDENKVDVDISLISKEEDKPADGGSVSSFYSILGMFREFPMEPINGKFKTHILNKNVLSVEGPTALSSKESGSMQEKEITADEKNGGKSLEYVSGGMIRILGSNKSSVAKMPYTGEELSFGAVIDKLNKKESVSNLGEIHVYPVNTGEENGISSKYIIPFEFNPSISENGMDAKFETASLMSRIGDITTYIKTGALTVQLDTKYQVLSVNPEENRKIGSTGDNNSYKGSNYRVGSWMDSFHLRNVQSIEMAYRGLVYPQLSEESGSYFRPPLIKIVFNNGGENKGADNQEINNNSPATPFNNLLTYPYKFSNSTKTYHRSFIVSKVDIKKDWNTMPLILNSNNTGIIDLQGFDVSLSLIEVDPMYIGILPSFEDYYSVVKNVK